MQIDYKKELEQASRGMILIHDPNLLIKLIVRMIVRKLGIRHAGMLVYDKSKDTFVLKISRGQAGYKIPQGFTRFDADNALIRSFTDKNYRSIINGRNALVYDDIASMIWQEGLISHGGGNGVKQLLGRADDQMKMLNIAAAVPSFYRDDLLAVLLLGEKSDGAKFEQQDLDFFAALASDTAMAIRNAQLFDGLQRQAKKNRRQFIQTIIVLSSTIEAKDAYTHGHTERVTKFSLSIARQMTNSGSWKFKEKFYESLYIASLLHDIGKIGIPESILLKRGALSKEEFEVIKGHPVKGADMVKPLDLPRECIDGICYHHERFDGLGYPGDLKAEDLPISAAIIAVADTFDAITSDRPYRAGMSTDEAIAEIQRCSGTQFHPLPAKAICELYDMGLV